MNEIIKKLFYKNKKNINYLTIILIISFFNNINAQNKPQDSLNQDVVYIYKEEKQNRTYVNYIGANGKNDDGNLILVQITYKIRPASFWKALEESKEQDILIGDTYHSNFTLSYVLGCSTNDNPLLKYYPNEFKLVSKEEKEKLDIVDWNKINKDEEMNLVLKKIANANVIYLVEKINKAQFIIRKVKMNSLHLNTYKE